MSFLEMISPTILLNEHPIYWTDCLMCVQFLHVIFQEDISVLDPLIRIWDNLDWVEIAYLCTVNKGLAK